MDRALTWIRGEWPLLLGLVVGGTLLGQHAFLNLHIPEGSDWGVYLRGAEHVWHPERDTTFPDWRTPAYAWLVGWLGESQGYVRAGQILSSVSALLTVLAAGLLGRALSTAWIGGLAAMAVAGFTPVAHGAHWVNHYPLLGATTGLALALGAMACRWPHAVLGAATGVAAGASVALDLRGMVVVAAGGILCSLALADRTRPWHHRGGTLGMFLVGILAVGSAENALAERANTRLMPLEKQVLHQRELTLDWQTWGNNPLAQEVQAACEDIRPGPLRISQLFLPCSRAMLSTNLQRLWNARSLPPAGSLWLLWLACLPGAWGRRSVLAGGVLVGVPLVSIGVGASWVTYWDRYVLQFAAPLAALGPVAIARVGEGVGRRFGRELSGTRVGAAVATAWVLLGWPKLAGGVPGAPPMREQVPAEIAAWAAENVGPEDVLVDCAGIGINQFLLPNRVPLVEFVRQPRACIDAVRRPSNATGSRYVLARHLPENHGGVETGVQAAELERMGWGRYQNWHVPPAQISIWRR
jgi:hypothetical protein